MKKLVLTTFIFLVAHFYAFAQYQLNGTAIETDDGCFQLTEELNTQAGSIWFLEQISLEESFSLNFDIFLGCLDANGADGIYFVLQPISTSLGSSGGDIGFGGIDPAIGVEFDTWQNGENGDPTFDHIAIQQNGDLVHTGPNNLAGPVQISATSTNVEDCEFHNARFTWNAETQTLSAFFDCVLRLEYTGDIVNDIFGGDPDVFWGFTAGTGGAFNIQTVCLDYVSFIDELDDVSICPGESTQLNLADGFEFYAWEPSDGLDDAFSASPIASPSVTTEYIATIIDDCGEELNDTVTVFVVNPEAVNLGADFDICTGETAILDATIDGATYLWSDASTNPTLAVNEAGTYSVTVTTECGSSTDEVVVGITIEEIVVDLGVDFDICSGETATLDATTEDATTYLWSDSSTNPTLAVNEAGTYSVTVTTECGSGTDEVVVGITIEEVVVDLGVAFDICSGETAILDATTEDATTYLWSDNSTNPTLAVNEAGAYSVTVTTDCGEGSDEILIGSIFNETDVDLGEDISICVGDMIPLFNTLPVEEGVNYFWNTSSTDASIMVSEAGAYVLEIFNDCGAGSDTIVVTTIDLPTVDLGDTNQNFCLEEENTLNAFDENADSYLWSNGSTEPSITIAETGIYSVTVSNECGEATDEVCAVVESCDEACDNMLVTSLEGCDELLLSYTVYLSVNGGIPPYTITGDITATLNEDFSVAISELLPFGYIYQINVTDATGCVRSILGKPDCNTLPVTLINFIGKVEPTANALAWTVGSEYNCDYYTLERSLDGNQFFPVSYVTGQGTTNQVQLYTYNDKNAPSGIAYYRLTQTDYDGTVHYLSSLVLMRHTEELNINRVFPVPADNEINVYYSLPENAKDEEVRLIVYDITGRRVYQQAYNANNNRRQHLIIDSSWWSAGVYTLALSCKDELRVQKIAIK